MLRAMQRRTMIILASALIVVGLFVVGIGYAAWWVIDNIDAPGPGVTGSGPCTAADAVNLQLVYAGGRTVQMCTRDRPSCRSQSQFLFGNQLRSSSRRYILSVRLDGPLATEAAEQTLPLSPGAGFMPGEQAPTTSTRALVEVTPRDPKEEAYLAVSGSLTVSSSHGVARGRIEGKFTSDEPTRSDRPAYVRATELPLTIGGTFACNR
jgi:hypothetical protein